MSAKLAFFATGLLILATCLVWADDDSDDNTITATNDDEVFTTVTDDTEATELNNEDADVNAVASEASDDIDSAINFAETNECETNCTAEVSDDNITTDIVNEAESDDSPEPSTETSVLDDEITSVTLKPETRMVCVCSLNYEPVCGSDGVTYSNQCILNCVINERLCNKGNPIHMLYRGECRDLPCNCPQVAQPLCGMNNQTYLNDCYFAYYNAKRVLSGLLPIVIAYRGLCKKASCVCPDTIIPLCGTDNKTYRNICILQCYSRLNQARGSHAIYVQCPGACKNETCNCPLTKKQLCASDENTYYNQCALDCENRRRNQLGQPRLTVQYPSECKKCICPYSLDPVCASDGKTYVNYCLLSCENQKRKRSGQPELTVWWRGACNCGCTKKWNPVCGSDSKTWTNRCQLDCENKKRLINKQPLVTLLYYGECSRCNCCHCSSQYDPVCGSDRQSYGNLCILKCHSDCRVASKLPPIWKISEGECC